MKPLKQKLGSSLAVFVFVFAAQAATAFYDPSLGRWINRDPSFDTGFRDLSHTMRRSSVGQGHYSFVDNRTVNSVDPFGLYSFETSCKTTQREKINAAIKANCSKAKSCACKSSLGAFSETVNSLCDNPDGTDPVINCPDANAPLPRGGTCDKCGKGDIGGNQIYICPDSFDPNKQDPYTGCPLSCVIFHETNHNRGLEDGSTDMNQFDKCMGCPRE